MRKFILLTSAVLIVVASGVPAQQQTWTGQIGDSRCGANHEEDADAAGGGRQGKPTDHECVLACVKGGSKFVLVTDGKMFVFENQADAALATLAGETVKVTGELKGNVIAAAKIEAQ